MNDEKSFNILAVMTTILFSAEDTDYPSLPRILMRCDENDLSYLEKRYQSHEVISKLLFEERERRLR